MLHKLITVLFSLSFLLPALFFMVLGKEAHVFATVGLGYFLISLVAIWLAFVFLGRKRPRRKTALLSGIGAALLAMAFPVYVLTEKYDTWHDQQIIEAQRGTEVFDLSDEPFRSAEGNLLGVRVRYAVRFPSSGRYAPGPRLLPADDDLHAFRGLTVLNTTVEPRPATLRDSPLTVPYGRYRAGVTYRFTVEMVPFYLIPSRDRSGFCMSFANGEEEEMAQSNRPTRFRVSIGGTSADLDLTGKALLTSQAYTLRDFYAGALAAGAHRPCRFDSAGNLR